MLNPRKLPIRLILYSEYYVGLEIREIKSTEYEEPSRLEENKTYGTERTYRVISRDHPTGDPDY
tara:strand:+ start:84 stop:275 length:192 start_codon:yes stop_codon:yes gene_type:complete